MKIQCVPRWLGIFCFFISLNAQDTITISVPLALTLQDKLIRLYRTCQGKNLEFTGLAVDKDEATIRAYTEKKGMTWDNIFFTSREAVKNNSVINRQF